MRTREPAGVKPSWVEVNIAVPYSAIRQFVGVHVTRLVNDPGIPWVSWHFMFEPDVRLRFLTADPGAVRARLREYLREQLGDAVKVRFGAHGAAGCTYEGEAAYWGDDWPIAMRMYQATSEMALRVHAARTARSREVHATRYIHILLNQLGYTYADEVLLYDNQHLAYLQLLSRLKSDQPDRFARKGRKAKR